MKADKFIFIHKNYVLAMRTSSQRLAAVRKREAMLLESVYSRSFCRNLASYLEKKRKKEKEKRVRPWGLGKMKSKI